MRNVKVGLFCLVSALSVMLVLAGVQKKQPRTTQHAYRENTCVTCHANLQEPVGISAHFYEWRNSAHERKGVSCEKCHGGDPTAKTSTAAHQGVLRPSFPASTLHPQNLAQTCRSCHQEIVNAFIKSRHFEKLQTSADAPNCTTCHRHMASSVITWPPDTAALCAKCHNASSGAAAQYPDVARQAGETIAAISRADGVVEWAQSLMQEGKQKKLSFTTEEARFKQFAAAMKQAKIDGTPFNCHSRAVR
ncbi:MAG: cytochrome c3 family protein [Blastocatellia bacterium]